MIEEPTNSFDDIPSACPFVAFEDDRDHRSDVPDFQHRCFAAPEPEPRAFPHQERYCLSAGFAACPIFLDWARQEAAAVKAATAAAAVTPVPDAGEVPIADGGPAFLATRPRPTPVEAAATNAASKRTGDSSAGLWSYDAETKRAATPAAPLPPSSLGAPAVAMARRGPTHPGWENPPRLETFPRLRSRDDNRANQPLLVIAVFVAAIMVALVAFPLVFGGKSGGAAPSFGSFAPVGSGASQVTGASPSAAPSGTVTMLIYIVKSGDYLAKIALKYNLDPADILAANPVLQGNPDHIEVGQRLKIPPAGYFTPSPAPATPTPAAT